MILRVMFPLQLLGIPKHALAFHVLPGQMFRSFNNNVKFLLGSPRTTLQQLHQGTAKRTMKALAWTVRSSVGVARATDSTGTIEPSNAVFLENDGRWIDYQEIFASNTRSNEIKAQDDSNFLRELTVTQLRQEARQRGQTSTGSREALIERMVSKQPPDPTRPRRRKHKPVALLPHGYVLRRATPRPRALHPYTVQLRVLSWNVNGIRAQLDKEEGRKAFQAVIAQERPHVLGLQEIRIAALDAINRGSQKDPAVPSYVDVVKSLLPDYDTIWLSSFPPARSGYSGTAMFVRKKREWDIGCPTLLKVRGGIGHTEGDLEGRVTTAEYDVVFVVNVYTPNSGAGLKRLAFRTGDWDEAFAAYVKGLEKIKPVVIVGDLNVAHEDKDFYNPEQRRTRKASGTTPEERSSFAINLLGRDPPPSCLSADSKSALPPTHTAGRGEGGGDAGPAALERQGRVASGVADGLVLVDTFREMHPGATGVFSFWSVRAGNRPVNRGMRLDYCLASKTLANGDSGVVHDAFVLDRETIGISDHCPVGVVLRLGDHYSGS